MNLAPATAESYLRHAFAQMLGVADRLGDERVNLRPHGEGTNSVAALVVHCCGVAEFWLGHVALGRPTVRDRSAEFSSTATVAELHALVGATLATAAADIGALEAGKGVDAGGRQSLARRRHLGRVGRDPRARGGLPAPRPHGARRPTHCSRTQPPASS